MIRLTPYVYQNQNEINFEAEFLYAFEREQSLTDTPLSSLLFTLSGTSDQILPDKYSDNKTPVRLLVAG